MGLRYPLAAALGVLLLGGGVAFGHGLIGGPDRERDRGRRGAVRGRSTGCGSRGTAWR